MKRWLFNLIYCGVLLFFAPMILYRSLRQGKYRNGFKQKFLGRVPKRQRLLKNHAESSNTKIIWFHAVSVGEINLLRPLLQKIRETQPDWYCAVSTTSKTGMDLAKQLFDNDWTVFYCPLDFSWAVEQALRRLKPDMLVLVEQELWPNLVETAKKNGTKLAIVNGRFGEGGYKRYLWIRPVITPLLQQFDLIAPQNELYAGWFRRLGVSSKVIGITGSIKFDGANTDRNNPETQRLRTLAGIADDDIVFLAGSTQYPEEMFAVECYEHLKRDFPKLRLIIVPRHPERFGEVSAMLDNKEILWERRSTLKSGGLTPSDEFGSARAENVSARAGGVNPPILLVDTVGELGGWWGTAAIAYVGGSMGKRGGQNMIEPAAYGAAVCFGPKTKNFRDIVEMMLRDDAAQIVHDQREMERFVRRCMEEPDFANRLGSNAQNLVQRQVGATQKTLELLQTLFQDAESEKDTAPG
jgi:3-deoxy-D-manno-octulosonic-acid transferase